MVHRVTSQVMARTDGLSRRETSLEKRDYADLNVEDKSFVPRLSWTLLQELRRCYDEVLTPFEGNDILRPLRYLRRSATRSVTPTARGSPGCPT